MCFEHSCIVLAYDCQPPAKPMFCPHSYFAAPWPKWDFSMVQEVPGGLGSPRGQRGQRGQRPSEAKETLGAERCSWPWPSVAFGGPKRPGRQSPGTSKRTCRALPVGSVRSWNRRGHRDFDANKGNGCVLHTGAHDISS